ncbi:N-formylglutamate deformylase [Sphingomonas paeninsulae]|jgi:N-formylglutamate deformylase|uniref:N-formylglutamate deformylase n=1 Tax=Sphingomonas paeninsulae TaxID=2319844 RepID=A0A494TCG3_SPHPE|nr:N-formylglutamate deformylase [Sphingomonas paeninsulae]AYJ87169.1 N-formylglutamate deformylase [Sphingomonas paeninsulae]
MSDWLEIHRGSSPLIVAFPHTGTLLPDGIERDLVSPWRALKDTDWWVDRLYDFARDMGATTIRTTISRTVIDVNRDPSGKSLYPGHTTTELCPTTTFDGEPLYINAPPSADEIAQRQHAYFDPYHQAIEAEIARLRAQHPRVVLYDAHSIRSRAPRLFDGVLPHMNIGTNGGTTCDPALLNAVETVLVACPFSFVTDGRFKGGWTTRHYGRPTEGIHAIQMELADRGYLDEPDHVSPENWPAAYSADTAAPQRTVLAAVLKACLTFTQELA